MLKLKPRKTSDSLIDLVLNPAERGIFALGALAVVGMNLPRPAFSAVSAVLLAACSAAALYVEKWRFDSERREILYTSGFYPFPRTRRYEFAGIETFELHRASGLPGFGGRKESGSAAHRELLGLLRRGTAALGLRTVEGRRVVIQVLQIRNEKEVEETAVLLASFCGLPLREI